MTRKSKSQPTSGPTTATDAEKRTRRVSPPTKADVKLSGLAGEVQSVIDVAGLDAKMKHAKMDGDHLVWSCAYGPDKSEWTDRVQVRGDMTDDDVDAAIISSVAGLARTMKGEQ